MFPVWRTKNVLPEANGEVACVHSVVGRVFLDSVEVLHPLATGNPKKKKKVVPYQNQCTQSCVVGVRQPVDNGMQRISPLNCIINACRLISICQRLYRGMVLTSCIDKVGIVLTGEERIRKFAEELFQ